MVLYAGADLEISRGGKHSERGWLLAASWAMSPKKIVWNFHSQMLHFMTFEFKNTHKKIALLKCSLLVLSRFSDPLCPALHACRINAYWTKIWYWLTYYCIQCILVHSVCHAVGDFYAVCLELLISWLKFHSIHHKLIVSQLIDHASIEPLDWP